MIVVDRAADNAKSVADSIGAQTEVVDVGNEAEITEMLLRIEDTHGPIDVLCNNAGIASGGDPLTTPLDEWQRQWDINVMSHVFAIRAVLPSMLARGEGHIQHTASMAGILTSHGNAPYATSKHAVVGLAEWMSITYHDKGIRHFIFHDDPEGRARDGARAHDVAHRETRLIHILGTDQLGLVGRKHGLDGVLAVGRGPGSDRIVRAFRADDAGPGHGSEIGRILRLTSLGEGIASVDDDADTDDDHAQRDREQCDRLASLG